MMTPAFSYPEPDKTYVPQRKIQGMAAGYRDQSAELRELAARVDHLEASFDRLTVLVENTFNVVREMIKKSLTNLSDGNHGLRGSPPSWGAMIIGNGKVTEVELTDG